MPYIPIRVRRWLKYGAYILSFVITLLIFFRVKDSVDVHHPYTIFSDSKIMFGLAVNVGCMLITLWSRYHRRHEYPFAISVITNAIYPVIADNFPESTGYTLVVVFGLLQLIHLGVILYRPIIWFRNKPNNQIY
jgi:hypothetical protein